MMATTDGSNDVIQMIADVNWDLITTCISQFIQQALEKMLSSSQDCQRERWVFTYNNYDRTINYLQYFRNSEFFINRAIWGYEIGEEGTPHLQGYLEFKRSKRLSHVRKILREAFGREQMEVQLQITSIAQNQETLKQLGISAKKLWVATRMKTKKDN